MVAMAVMCGTGFYLMIVGRLPEVESASLQIEASPGYEGEITTIGLMILLARAFSSGCAALTGVEAISNGVPAFRRPKSQNAATTLLLLGLIAITMMLSVITLARQMGVRYVDPHQLERLRLPDGSPVPEGYEQHTLIAQISDALFEGFPPGFYFVVITTGVILVLAANTAFNGFPVLGSILAEHGLLPRALGSRGDRLAYSNGIVFLAVMAIILILAFDAQVTRLIQLYIVGVFVSFNLSQLGMIRHWTRHLRTEKDPAERLRMQRSRLINAIGLTFTSVVLVVVLITKFIAGAWIAILAMAAFFLVMQGISRHYENVAIELAADEEDKVLPTRVHAIVLVSKLHKPTLRALAFAKASRPNVLEGVYVGTDPAETNRLLAAWEERNLGVPLKVLYSPYREIVRPISDYAQEIRRANPRGVVAVYIPEYVVGRWWEQLLHNQTALRLKGRLLFSPGVMVISVPYQLRSSQIAAARERHNDERVRSGAAVTGGTPADPTRRVARGGAPHRRRRPDRARRSLCRTCRRTGGVRASRAAGGASRGRGHRGQRGRSVLARRRRGGAELLAGPGDAALSLRRSGRVRWLRLPARRVAGAAWAQGGCGARAAVAAHRTGIRRGGGSGPR
jgi:hypothetical protein